LAPPCPGPEGGRWKGYLSEGEAQRFAALASATANGLLVIFVLAVALPLLPTKLADPFWLLAFSGAFCTNGFLALLAVLLQLAVVLHAEISSMGHGPDRHSRLALVAALDFALLIPLQLISTWGCLNQQASGENRQRLQGLAVIGQLNQAITASSQRWSREGRGGWAGARGHFPAPAPIHCAPAWLFGAVDHAAERWLPQGTILIILVSLILWIVLP
jgi:hypothetical protein